jgi:raffinose/stachyose/melibiose transport system permease protein
MTKIVPYLFIIPAFIVHICLVTGPSLSTLIMSLFEWNGIGGGRFIGLANFEEIFLRDGVVRIAVWNNVKWLLIFITVPIILGLAAAMMVSNINRFQMVFRTVFFVPYVLSAAVIGKIFTAYYNPYYGINVVFKSLGWEKLANTLWIADPNIALYAVAFVDNWHWWGFVMVMFLAALQQIDPSLYESARIDGANTFQEVFYVSIPGIKQTIAFMLIMTVMWSFLTFDYVYVMTYGGPANATEILATWIYKNAFVKYNAGYANALCVIQSGICLIFYFLQRYISKKGGLEEE